MGEGSLHMYMGTLRILSTLPSDPTVGLCINTYGRPRGWGGLSCEPCSPAPQFLANNDTQSPPGGHMPLQELLEIKDTHCP